jgi:large subunit ribosomal protein L15
MRLHDLRAPDGARHRRRRLGRGISAGQGKTAGRGTKGQLARSGPGLPGWFEGGQTPIHMRVPKLRGFKNRLRIPFTAINVGRLAAAADNGVVTPDLLVQKGFIPDGSRVKVLGEGPLSAALQVSAHAVSKTAKAKIEAAGGSITLLERPKAEAGNGDEGGKASP